MINFIKGLESEYNPTNYSESIYQCTDSNKVFIFGNSYENNIIDISNKTIDLNDCYVPQRTYYYYCESSSASTNITNLPKSGGFLLESKCILYKEGTNLCIQQTLYQTLRNNTTGKPLVNIFQRTGLNNSWTDWNYIFNPEYSIEYGTSNTYYSPFKIKTTGFYLANLDVNLDTITYGDPKYLGSGVSLNYMSSAVNLHLKGTAGSTTYEIVGQNSVGHWFSKNKIKDFYSPERIIFNKNSNITASIISYDEEKKTVTLDKTLNPDDDWEDYTCHIGNYVNYGIVFGYGGVAKNYSTVIGGESIATGDLSSALGDRCSAMGDSSIALCWQTITRNQGELATGRSNISHSGSSSDKQTIFSVGSGAIWDNSGIQKNAIEVMANGDVYIEGIGDYDGVNNNFTAKTVQKVISELQNNNLSSIPVYDLNYGVDHPSPIFWDINSSTPLNDINSEYSEKFKEMKQQAIKGNIKYHLDVYALGSNSGVYVSLVVNSDASEVLEIL